MDQLLLGYDCSMAVELALPESNARISLSDAMQLRRNLDNLFALCNQIQTMGAAVLGSFHFVTDAQSSSVQGVVPSIEAFPPWASKCVVSRGRRRKETSSMSVHLSDKEILNGKTSVAYELMAAARSHCIACIRRYLLKGHTVHCRSDSGWNAYDNAHYRDSDRREATLQYLGLAGLGMSTQYQTYRIQQNLLMRCAAEGSVAIYTFKIPRLDGYPAWGSVCDKAGTRSVDVEPGEVHVTDECLTSGETFPEYFIIAAARANCLYCLRLCLTSGYMIGTSSRCGWNVWDHVHETGGEKVADVLRFVEEAGGQMSALYARWMDSADGRVAR